MQDAGESRADPVGRRSRPQPANDPQPGGHRLPQDRGVAVDQWFLIERDEEVGWIAA
jgi:hypothetical protein